MPARKPFLLRLPPDLLEDLRRWAEDDMRSLNAQIEYLLRQMLLHRRRVPGPQPPDDEDDERP